MTPIPDGYYTNHSVSFDAPTLLATNILSGVSIFGVTGSFKGLFKSSMASTMFRDKAAPQILLEQETVTDAGTAYTNSAAGYRAVPDILNDDDGRSGLLLVDRSAGSTTGAWAART